MTFRRAHSLGVVDIGTNSLLLLIAQRDEAGVLNALFEDYAITRLGTGVSRCQQLAPEAISRTLEALKKFRHSLDDFHVADRWALGTAALRMAQNSQDFLVPAATILGCEIEVITGQREAELVWAGVESTMGAQTTGAIVFDVGGGSTEFIGIEPNGQLISASLPLGVVALTEHHLHSNDPLTKEALATTRQEIDAQLAKLSTIFSPKTPTQTLIGVSGTVTTLAAMELGLANYDSRLVNQLCLKRPQLFSLLDNLAYLPLAKRQNIAGLEAGRADVIVAGVLIVLAVMDYFTVQEVRVCDRGLRWGYLHKYK